MAKMLSMALVLVVSFALTAVAHHPAEDMVDDEIYDEISLMVADTPHAELEFEEDDEMAEMTIDIEDVGSTDDLIDDGLLDDISLLDGEVTVTITFPEEAEDISILRSVESMSGNNNGPKANFDKKWSEWGRPVQIHILQIKP